MITNEKLIKLKEISDKNETIIKKVSADINELEDFLNSLCLFSLPIRTSKINDYIFDVDKQNGGKYRIYVEYMDDRVEFQRRALGELPCNRRIEAFSLIDHLIDEIYENQTNKINEFKDK